MIEISVANLLREYYVILYYIKYVTHETMVVKPFQHTNIPAQATWRELQSSPARLVRGSLCTWCEMN